jgi:hypothetical protein
MWDWSFVGYVTLGVLILGWTGVVFANALRALFSTPSKGNEKREPNSS